MHITAVVPVHNEKSTLAQVLSSLQNSSLFDEIIVINDGSTDGSHNVALNYNVRLINLKRNYGKSLAVKKVCKGLNTDIIFFCDADLIGLNKEIIKKILSPVLNKEAGMSIGLRNVGFFNSFYKIALLVSGERAILNSHFQEIIKSKYFTHYGMESVMNEYCKLHNIKIKSEIFNYTQTFQTKKIGVFSGFFNHLLIAIQAIYVTFAIRIQGKI